MAVSAFRRTTSEAGGGDRVAERGESIASNNGANRPTHRESGRRPRPPGVLAPRPSQAALMDATDRNELWCNPAAVNDHSLVPW